MPKIAFKNLMQLFVIIIALFISAQASATKPEEVLIVGEERFLRFELDEVINSFLPSAIFHGGISDKKRKTYARKAIDVLIDRALLYQDAYAAGIRISPDIIESVLEKNIAQFGSQKNFDAAIKKSGLTLKRFKHRIIQQHTINEHLKLGLAVQSHYNKKELRTYYDKHPKEFTRPETIGLWHIILKVKPNAKQSAWDEKKKLAEKIANRAYKGEDFSKLARDYSEGDYRVKGGWIGYLHRGRLLEHLESAAFALKKNEISKPIRSLHGYHIIKAGSRRQAGDISFKDSKDKLKQRLEKYRLEKLREKLLNKLRKKTSVKILIDLN